MNTTTAYQLRRLDQALLSLLDERRRLVEESGAATNEVAIDDLLRRHDGPFPAASARDVFRAVETGCSSEVRP
jgi:hypothetical protein